MITETDDFFCHQTIQPHAYVALNDLSWGERAYHTLSDPDRFGLDIGVATYPNRGMFHTYAIAAVPGRQWSLRATRDYSEGRWELRAGPIQAKIVEPMRRWTYTCGPNESGIEFDLEFQARNGPYMIGQPPIRKGGRLIHEDVYVFQVGFYSGTVTLDGTTFDVDRVPGARDRTWGIRAAGEGQLPHGVLAWLNANFDDVSIIAHIRDRGDDVPQVRDGAVYRDGGDIVPIVGFEHDLRFDYETRQCEGGTIVLTDARGEVWPIEIDPASRLEDPILRRIAWRQDDGGEGRVAAWDLERDRDAGLGHGGLGRSDRDRCRQDDGGGGRVGALGLQGDRENGQGRGELGRRELDRC